MKQGLNQNTLLFAGAKNARRETKALQYYINAYYSGQYVIPITGVFDAATENAVKSITGKTSTCLYEFVYIYLMPVKGNITTTNLVNAINAKFA